MNEELLIFGENRINKRKFHYTKTPVWINNEDIHKTLVSDKIAFGKKNYKYFIRYKDGRRISHLCIMLPEMSRYVKMLMKLNMSLLKKYNDI